MDLIPWKEGFASFFLLRVLEQHLWGFSLLGLSQWAGGFARLDFFLGRVVAFAVFVLICFCLGGWVRVAVRHTAGFGWCMTADRQCCAFVGDLRVDLDVTLDFVMA